MLGGYLAGVMAGLPAVRPAAGLGAGPTARRDCFRWRDFFSGTAAGGAASGSIRMIRGSAVGLSSRREYRGGTSLGLLTAWTVPFSFQM
jgi:hypothetical protein